MIDFFRGPDREMKIIYSVLLNGSMCLTAFFGWTLADGILPLQIVLALMFAAISRAVGGMFMRASEYRLMGDYIGFGRCVVLGALFAAANIVTDYGSSAAIRDNNIVSSQNQNTKARDTRSEIKRLQTRISEIKAQTAWQGTFLAPEAYDPLIEAAKLYVANEAKRGGCGPICERKTREMADLQAAKQNSLQRQSLKAEMKVLEAELVDAKRMSATTAQTVSSPALAQVKSVIAWFTLSRSPDAGSLWWGNNSIMLWGSVIITLAIIYLAWEIGSRSVPQAAYSAPQRRVTHQPVNITPDQHQAAQQAAMREYREKTTIVERNNDGLEALARDIEALGGEFASKAQRLRGA